MKRVIASSAPTNLESYLKSEKVDQLLQKCTEQEQRLFDKLVNSNDPEFYLVAMEETIDILYAKISPAFNCIIHNALGFVWFG